MLLNIKHNINGNSETIGYMNNDNIHKCLFKGKISFYLIAIFQYSLQILIVFLHILITKVGACIYAGSADNRNPLYCLKFLSLTPFNSYKAFLLLFFLIHRKKSRLSTVG